MIFAVERGPTQQFLEFAILGRNAAAALLRLGRHADLTHFSEALGIKGRLGVPGLVHAVKNRAAK